MLILALVGASHRLNEIMGGSSVYTMGSIISAAWVACVAIGTICFRLAYRGWQNEAFVADLAEIASWTGVGILPFTGLGQFAASLLQ
jgi:hypothetical protein